MTQNVNIFGDSFATGIVIKGLITTDIQTHPDKQILTYRDTQINKY